jgi:hypothetical protein
MLVIIVPRQRRHSHRKLCLTLEVLIGCPALINQRAPIPAVALSMRAGHIITVDGLYESTIYSTGQTEGPVRIPMQLLLGL